MIFFEQSAAMIIVEPITTVTMIVQKNMEQL